MMIKGFFLRLKLLYFIFTAPVRSWITKKYRRTNMPTRVAMAYYDRILGDTTTQAIGPYEIQAEEVLHSIYLDNKDRTGNENFVYETARPQIACAVLMRLYKYAPAKEDR